ncbi:MAG: antibiotic biosynthesis monooxygenase [Candidatus Dormibacteraeota bacterium]|nr:antibiotic biosynthesis monooxygenase [Candidatus Dormibacteraeota bacterium]
MFGLVVRFDLKPGAAGAFDQLVAQTVAQIHRREPGTVIYACHTVEGEPLARVFYELYEDRDAFDAHEAQDHVRRFLAERKQYLAGTRVEFLDLHADLVPPLIAGTAVRHGG